MAFEFVVQCQKTDKILRENPQKPFVDSYEENVSVKSETIDEGMSRQEALRKTPDDSNDDKVSVKVEPIEQIIVESVSDQASTNIFVIEDYPGDDGIKEEFIDDTEFDENDIIEVDEDFVDETSDIVFSIHVDEYNKEVTSQDTILTLEPDIVQSVAISSTYITSNRVPATSKVKTKKQPRTKENKTYICPVCSATFADHSEFIMHKKTHYPYRSACKICGKQFIKSSGLQTHMDVHNGIKFSCHLCDKQCSTRANLTRHIRQCHDKIRPYSCKVCGRQFSQRTTLDGHAATHTEERNFACDMCGKTYKSVFVLNAHKRTHHPNFVRTKKVKYDKRNKYVCEQCGKVSNSLVYHKLHTKLHSDVKKFECEVCHKQFHLKVWLNVHMRIHTDERPYICEICGKAFRQVNHLKYHKRVIHEPEAARQFACKFCGKSFTSAGTLRVHERIHTGEKPYKCDDCLACFIDINGLKRHRAKVHSMESSKHNSIMIEEYIVCNEDTPEIDGNKE